MPVIIVESNKLALDKKRKYVKELTKITAEAYDLPETAVTIILKENKSENIGVGGDLLSERG
ncbi:MAG: tautomerase family protein [Methanobrevibacter sp.]|jgi:4-oxalocrotonate tautomerase|nr:tautomerase family protein [Methanobrevibacter sp.]